MSRPRRPKADRSFTVPLYGGRVYLYTNPDKLNQASEHFGLDRADTDSLHGIFRKTSTVNGSVYLIGQFTPKRSILVHEAAHCAMNILHYVGIPTNEESDEAFCYLLDHLCTKLGLDE